MNWYKADSASAGSSDIPMSPSVSISSGSYQAGEAVLSKEATPKIRVASNILKGTFSGENQYSAGDVVWNGGSSWVSLGNVHHGEWNGGTLTMQIGETIFDGTNIYQNTSAAPVSLTAGNVLGGVVGLTSGTSIEIALGGNVTNGNNDVTNHVFSSANQVITNGGTVSNTYFTESPWQYADPSSDTSVQISRTNEFTNVNDKSIWTKTHYSHLDGKTINTSYTRGDNIYYQGKNYVYTSHLNSDHALYQSPQDGYTEFSELLRLNAITEVPMFIDTLGGGGSANLPSDIYFRRNQDLQFVDRLPGSGEVRSTNMARRTDAPLPPGDEIFNSPDDAFYGGLQAGNDGIYGTMDDYYSSTADIALAQASPHMDADADNNKDLLDISNNLEDFSVADFVDYIQTLANVRAVNGGTMSRLNYAERILEENEINLGAASSRIMDTDMATESARMARQNVLMQAAASMVSQANAMNNVVLSLLQ